MALDFICNFCFVEHTKWAVRTMQRGTQSTKPLSKSVQENVSLWVQISICPSVSLSVHSLVYLFLSESLPDYALKTTHNSKFMETLHVWERGRERKRERGGLAIKTKFNYTCIAWYNIHVLAFCFWVSLLENFISRVLYNSTKENVYGLCKTTTTCFVDDSTRVILETEDGTGDSDLINACYVNVCKWLSRSDASYWYSIRNYSPHCCVEFTYDYKIVYYLSRAIFFFKRVSMKAKNILQHKVRIASLFYSKISKFIYIGSPILFPFMSFI